MAEQLGCGTHYGACHELEIRWAEQVLKMIPGIDRVRFVGSGTEATLLAIRLARAATGRDKIIKFEGHFHGWHDAAAVAIRPPFDRPVSAGVPRGIRDDILICPPNNWDAFMTLVSDRDDIAGAILEPAGGSCGTIPTDHGFLQQLRDVTRAHGIVLIFDEVITGFRLAPGGAQQRYGIHADLTTLAKILAGGSQGAPWSVPPPDGPVGLQGGSDLESGRAGVARRDLQRESAFSGGRRGDAPAPGRRPSPG
ncbi:MAG: aminotransferase class III-fold pyridoxal phosphate-dependent enzyme [Candidatus Methylomirabilis sp.]|nr:aminotransferase class III-fold pyridoxal phosphate-dependent enzyme [Candidatus Methylomirabilis sp.]